MNIHKFMMPEIIFGNGSIQQVGESCLRLGATNVLIVSDPGVIAAGWLDVVIQSCKQAGLKYTTFSDITINPKDEEVEKGCRVYMEHECDSIIGVGGGSSIDVAKAIAILATNGGQIQSYEGVDKIHHPLPPQVMVATTAGSGSEVSQFSVIVDTKKQKKMTIISRSLIPDIAIIDPETLVTKSAELTGATGMDVLTHGIEAYVSLAATPLTDVQAKNAISLVAEYLRPSVASKMNREAKTNMAMASLQSGLAFSNAILGAVHAMSHAVGGKYNLLHGDVNSILLPHVMEYNLLANPKKFADIALFLGMDIRGMSHMEAGRRAIEYVKQLTADIGAPQRLSSIGVEEEEMKKMSLMALHDACMITNPRDVTAEDIEEIFRRAW
ncbi:iron-containing alcohol dehydrogenase family protein [Anoxybacillus sp. B7M1]|jgi:alcohol dehydrogenase class IV|uniref:long-chain-alcohol dehydrogenase n=1 Tax=Anoxybacteroides rupiense TaxID=311460 RepID=A0ABD5IVI8_9BACL|nr:MULTISPECIES: iron-containing alcohol dehydrogenase [Anoxybacillus]ANB58886.1 iron-containing alcohol dehydrogenase family protein [Anoxybacillus sp. B2M1]ANB65667.1 iron-containing alcohol dehydrogenase family protein [Anoxybacillus sp. B7M1]KXG08526.1 1,3-propanediol dehydrogenase [Anoxybacillus sp. P3H1B]MBB3908290.1 1,3-propanediol dehydrogenase [Anoxybacillus rupiensis]MDE8563894.1 iron-containing alcohol dehydrogenase [Anoxybacillus rupiensis]